MISILTYALIGAILGGAVGYATNKLAIWMLFHPAKPVKLFSLTIFPAGLMVKKQHAIADKVGEVVAKEFINSKTVLEKFESGNMKNAVENGVRKVIIDFLEKDFGTLKESLSSNLYQDMLKIKDDIIQTVTPVTAKAITSDSSIEWLSGEIIKIASSMDDSYIKNILANEISSGSDAIAEELLLFINKWLGEDKNGDKLMEVVLSTVKKVAASIVEGNPSIAMFVNVDDLTSEAALKNRDKILDEIKTQLNKRESALEIEAAVKESSSKIIASVPIKKWLSSNESKETALKFLYDYRDSFDGNFDFIGSTLNLILIDLIEEFRIGKIGEKISSEQQDRIAQEVTSLIFKEAMQIIPDVVKELPVADIVSEQISAYTVLQMEQTVNSVAKNEMKAIINIGGWAGIFVGATGQIVIRLYNMFF